MGHVWRWRISAVLFAGITTAAAFGQRQLSTVVSVPSRITAAVDNQTRITLKGNTHPMARSAYDRGQVDSALPMERMQLVLKRSLEQEAALAKFVTQQYDPNSPNFHHWLHADEFGRLYGPSDSDVATVSSWLRSQGLTVDAVSKGRVTIEFSGTATQVQQAFHIQMHHYMVNGQIHLANDRDPQIPEALSPVVTGISSLHDFFPKHESKLGRYVTKNRHTGKVTPLGSAPRQGAGSQYMFKDPNANDAQNEDIGPYDFAAMYNLTPLWNSGITGKNVSIAIAAQSDIKLADVTTFRTFFGLNKFAGTASIVLNGADPGLISGDQVENTLDTEWAGASAPDAKVLVVVSKATATTSAIALSMSYIVDQEVAPIMSASYGECEAYLGSAGNSALNAIYQQGSAEGISLFESAGDQGSTGCDSDRNASPYAAENGLEVNGFASSPYITGVGGTDILWQNKPVSTYWTANDGNNASAIGHIPEIPWNSTCTSSYLLSAFTGEASSERLCNDALGGSYYDLVNISGGSGGASSCIGGTGTTASCTGAYPKPAWQTGAGVPTDGVRDVPDVSLFASGGFPDGIVGSAYLLCVSSLSPDSSCDYTGDNVVFQEVGGTSVSSPAMAGIMALVLQKTGSQQGLANPIFYQLAAAQNTASCNSSTVSASNNCVFYDVTSGTNAMPCIAGSPGCVVSTTGDQVGISSGYTSAAGYDLATGLGSVNAYNLVNAWPSVSTPTPTASVSPTSFTFSSTVVNTTSAMTGVITVTNTGSTAISFASATFGGTDSGSFASTTTCAAGSTLAAGASCPIILSFHPTATGTLTATLNIVDGAGTQTVSVSGVATSAPTTTLTVTPTSLTFAPTNVETAASTQVVALQNTGAASITFGAIALTGANADSFAKSATTCSATLAAGASCTISVGFTPTIAGGLTAMLSIADNATGSPQTVTLAGTGVAVIVPTTTSLATSASAVGVGMSVTLTATVKATAGTPGGTVTFYNGTTSLGTGTLNASGAAILATAFATAGTYSITASYAGSATFGASTSLPLTETVTAVGVTATVSPSTLTIQSGNSGTLTITATPSGGYAGTLSFTCGTLPQYISCAFAPASLAITAAGGPVTDTLTISTTASSMAMNHVPPIGGMISAVALWFPGSLAGLLGLARRKRFATPARQLWIIAFLCLGLAGIGALSGCSGGGSNNTVNTTSTVNKTPAGSYTVPITISLSGAASQTVNATVVVQ